MERNGTVDGTVGGLLTWVGQGQVPAPVAEVLTAEEAGGSVEHVGGQRWAQLVKKLSADEQRRLFEESATSPDEYLGIAAQVIKGMIDEYVERQAEEAEAERELQALVLVALSQLPEAKRTEVEPQMRAAMTHKLGWLTQISDDIWWELMAHAPLTTWVQLSRVNKALHDRLENLVAQRSTALRKDIAQGIATGVVNGPDQDDVFHVHDAKDLIANVAATIKHGRGYLGIHVDVSDYVDVIDHAQRGEVAFRVYDGGKIADIRPYVMVEVAEGATVVLAGKGTFDRGMVMVDGLFTILGIGRSTIPATAKIYDVDGHLINEASKDSD